MVAALQALAPAAAGADDMPDVCAKHVASPETFCLGHMLKLSDRCVRGRSIDLLIRVVEIVLHDRCRAVRAEH